MFAHHIFSAVDAQQILHSATINVNVAEDFVGRTDQATIGADQPTVQTLYRDAVGQFNKAGEEWNWFAYQVTAPMDGTYTLGVKTAGSKFDAYQIPLCVNGQVYALQCTAKNQTVTAEVTLPAGEHTVVMFMPMPATKADIKNNVWNDYHWCNVRSVTVVGALTVSKPTAAEVEVEFTPVIIPAVDTEKLLLSATIKKNANACTDREEYDEYAEYIWAYTKDNTDRLLTESALAYIKKEKPDFVFLYMVETDEKGGHDNGWMSEPYLKCIHDAIDNVKHVLEEAGDEYTVIVTADHGGHDRAHGSLLPEDMTIPMFFVGPDFEPGKKLTGIGLLDIAPTIAQIMGVAQPREWEGKSLVGNMEE